LTVGLGGATGSVPVECPRIVVVVEDFFGGLEDGGIVVVLAEDPTPAPATLEVVVAPEVAALHVAGIVITLSSSVTAPFLASSRPFTVAPVFAVMLLKASTEPAKAALVPIVAELVTCQNTHPAWAPFVRTMLAELATFSAEPAWKMKTEAELPPPSRVRAPERSMVDEELYTPGDSV
jgi:hypothetical protein